MTAGVLFALASMVVHSFADLLYKRGQVRGIVPETFLVFQSYTFGLTSFLIALFAGHLRLDGTTWKYGPPTGLLAFAASYAFLRSLKRGEAGIHTTILRLSFVLTVLLAIIFLEEPLSARRVAGLLSAILAISAFLPLALSAGGRRGDLPSLLLALLAMVFLGGLHFVYKLAAMEGVEAPSLMFVQFCFYSSSAMAYSALTTRFRRTPETLSHGLLAGVLIASALTLLIYALRLGDASVMVPIQQMSFVLTAFLAIFFFKESFSPLKGLSLALAVASIFLLSA